MKRYKDAYIGDREEKKKLLLHCSTVLLISLSFSSDERT